MNKKIKIAIILIAIILIAAITISIAYSRYYTKGTGEGSATVAKWSFKVNEQTDNIGTITLGNTASDNNEVAEGKIAPGTSGQFDVNIDATGSEVGIDYTIKIGQPSTAFPTNLKFYEDASHQKEIANLQDVGLAGSIGLADTTKTKTVSIYWDWEYGTDNDEDTLAGKNAETITFDVFVTGIQKAKTN